METNTQTKKQLIEPTSKVEYKHLALYAGILVALGLIWDGAARLAKPYPKTEVHVFQVTTTNTYVLTNIHTREIIRESSSTPWYPTNIIYIDNAIKPGN